VGFISHTLYWESSIANRKAVFSFTGKAFLNISFGLANFQ